MKLITLNLAALVALMASCTKDLSEKPSKDTGQPASITITVGGEIRSTRGIDENEVIPEENTIHDYTVYVVNSNTNKIQAVQTFESGLTNTVTGLTTGPKKVVVVTNSMNTIGNPPKVGDDCSKFDNPQSKLILTTQAYDYMPGLGSVMSGEAEIDIAPGHNVMPATLKVKRVIAKVKLGNLTIAPTDGQNGTFTLEKVMIMKARKYASYGPNEIFVDEYFDGGMVGNVSQMENIHLSEFISNTDTKGRLFYVFPNDNSNGNATLLTVQAKYNGEVRYFPVRINDGTGGSNGKFIERNGVYTINMTIKHPADGSTDPEVPVDPATLDLTIDVQPWETELIQNVEI